MIKGAAEAQAEFMRGCRQDVQVGNPQGALADLYVELIKEECQETVDAWNEAVLRTELAGDTVDLAELTAKVVDGAVDTIFVSLGLLNALGVDAEEAWQEVVKSNRSKLGPNPKFREDGKLLKDENFVEPDFVRVVKQSWGMQ